MTSLRWGGQNFADDAARLEHNKQHGGSDSGSDWLDVFRRACHACARSKAISDSDNKIQEKTTGPSHFTGLVVFSVHESLSDHHIWIQEGNGQTPQVYSFSTFPRVTLPRRGSGKNHLRVKGADRASRLSCQGARHVACNTPARLFVCPDMGTRSASSPCSAQQSRTSQIVSVWSNKYIFPRIQLRCAHRPC